MATSLAHLLIVLSFLHLAESTTVATGATCVSGNDTCTDPQANCTAGTSGNTTCECNTYYYDDSGNCTHGVDLNGNCSGITAGLKDTACQVINGNTTCVTSGGNSSCTCNSGYYDDDGAGTPGGSCVAVLTTACTNETNCGMVDSNAECAGTTGPKTCKCKSGYTGSAGDVCTKNGVERNSLPFWLLVCLAFLTAKSSL